ncbi:hypothetical protein AYL99_11908 [Fonsecaea erecta]|uniref:Uncharacterized protein n=1 Tax=Fonsecaea erecta TaxID=1367422 RepID=A0A178Z387_9EURO|nr:hypothetical protein AYL99_11908 [Fonsecaea erecta]OAP53886.1 hypothetical protein AYL99_11908 [Fonsecaea erecta]
MDDIYIDDVAFVIGSVVLAALACFITLYSKTVVPSQIASTFDENLGAVKQNVNDNTDDDKSGGAQLLQTQDPPPPNVYYSAAGSGVAEVSYYFPSKTLFRTFFCCIVAALSLKFLNPIGTSKSVTSPIGVSSSFSYSSCWARHVCTIFSTRPVKQ